MCASHLFLLVPRAPAIPCPCALPRCRAPFLLLLAPCPAQKRLATETKQLSELKAAHVPELLKFLGKAPLPEATTKALEEAEVSYASAVAAAQQLTDADVETLSDMPKPSEVIVSVVEAACIALGVTPDYDTAREKLLSSPHLQESIQKYDKTAVPPNVVKQLQRRSAVSLPADALPCVTALNNWIKSLLQLDALSDDIATERAKLSVSPAMQVLCLSVCDIFGIGHLDEDLMAGLKLAEAELEEERQGSTQQILKDSSAEEEKLEEEMEALEDKMYYLDQFKNMLTTGVEDLKPKIKPAQDEMMKEMQGLTERPSEVKMELQKPLGGKLSVGDSLIQDSCMILSLMFVSDRDAAPADICLQQLLTCDSSATLMASTKRLSTRVIEGDVIAEHLQQILMLSERIEDVIRFDIGGSLENAIQTSGGRKFVTAVQKLVSCFNFASELGQKSAQLMGMLEDQKTAATRLGLLFSASSSPHTPLNPTPYPLRTNVGSLLCKLLGIPNTLSRIPPCTLHARNMGVARRRSSRCSVRRQRQHRRRYLGGAASAQEGAQLADQCLARHGRHGARAVRELGGPGGRPNRRAA